ncbi:uracil-DNA glycosylase family protein (plasmid) [Halobacterium sp. NMX12-1]|uniref:Uracil-DNA glycosylase family protein n=1 Tax=Halobacterium sp. NMX12-1 TaxID=3166650 RepID=A0AAU8CGC9_9EURY
MDETTARDLLSLIDQPPQPELQTLQKSAIDDIESVLSQAGFPVQAEVCRRLSYTFYYDWETDDPDYVLLVQDPGNLHERHLSELRPHNPLAGDCSARDQISVYRAFGQSWLTGRNADFTERFFETLAHHDLISLPSGWHQYVASGQFYHDFYLGDVVKYRVDGFGTSEERVSYHALLERELQALDPEVVFTFGGNAWPALRRHTSPEPVVETDADPASVMDIHGTLHRISDPVDTYVLPLAHMSGQVWWRFPPDEYIARLSTALQVLQQHK